MSTKKALSAPFSKGVNFTNWLEYRPAEHIDENMYSKQDFINAKSLGCDVVRLPIHFEKFCFEEDGFIIPDKILGILDKVSAWAEELKIYVIFDFHNNTRLDSQTSEDVSNILSAVWTQLAHRYGNSSDYLVYELMNEPHGIEIEVWNKIIDKLFGLVRKLDKKHYIIVGGADWNSFTGMKALPIFKDDKVIYTFHFYDPHTFTHQGAMWCDMQRVVGIPFPYDPLKMPKLPENPTPREIKCFEEYPQNGTVEEVVRFFDQYVDFSIERNAPVYCGEFGCFAPFADRSERVNWYDIVAGLLEERNIARTSWDYYGPFGIYKFVRHTDANGKPIWVLPTFPQDLDTDIIKALRLNCPLE